MAVDEIDGSQTVPEKHEKRVEMDGRWDQNQHLVDLKELSRMAQQKNDCLIILLVGEGSRSGIAWQWAQSIRHIT